MISDNKKRIQISLSKKTMEQMEIENKDTGLTKSVIIELALNDYFNKRKVIWSKQKKHSNLGGLSGNDVLLDCIGIVTHGW